MALEHRNKETGEHKTVPLLKYYYVFHISQCDGMKPRFATFHSDLQPDKKAESIIDNYVRRSGVTLKRIQSDKAYYSPSTDTIVVPEISQYSDVAEFYSTVFHESVHSTGHHTRLNRITDVARYGSESYSKEELIAELGSAFLINSAGLEIASSFKNSSAYISGWLKAFKGDRSFIVSAAGKAEQVVHMILGVTASV